MNILLILYKAIAINVFIVPHSHNDAGWLLTPEQYYSLNCKYTLNNALDLMQTFPDFKFCWAEIIFLKMWLDEYPEKKEMLIQFIHQGRFEIVGGGWVQNDEALPDFELILRQMQTGFEYVKKELGVSRVKTGWQLDPFGHSSLTPALWEKLGFESLVFSRIDKDMRVRYIKAYLEFVGGLEFIWKGEGFGGKKGVFTHVLNYHYSFPEFIRYVNYSSPVPLCYKGLPADEEDIKNCTEKLESFVKYSQHKYRTDNQLLLLGDDFSYVDNFTATEYIKLWRQVIENAKGVNARFSTPSEYFEQVLRGKEKFLTFFGDFFPLVSNANFWASPFATTWTGFYSTKPYLKKNLRDLQKLVRNADLVSLFSSKEEFVAYELCTVSHHDAITGTCKHDVYIDYLQKIEEGRSKALRFLSGGFDRLLKPKIESSLSLPIKVVFLLNSLNWKVKETLHIRSKSQFARIFDSQSRHFPSQSVPFEQDFQIYFEVELNAFEVKVLYLSEFNVMCDNCSLASRHSEETSMNNSHLSIHFKKGLIFSLNQSDKEYILDSKIVSYNTNFSGPYTFVPYDKSQEIGELASFTLYSGEVVQIAESKFTYHNLSYTQRVVLPNSQFFYLFFSLYAEQGADIFLSFLNPAKSEGFFYTFNSANIQRRFYVYEDYLTKGSNYYPINGGLLIDLESTFLHIFPVFQLGAGMPDSSKFELNLHRHPDRDDFLGIGEYSKDEFPVQHMWKLYLSDLDIEKFWKSYLTNKNGPSVYYLQSISGGVNLTENYLNAEDLNFSIKFEEFKNVLIEDDCKYISKGRWSSEKVAFDVLNICNKKQELGFFEKFAEVKLENERKFKTEGEFENYYRKNSGKFVLKYEEGDGEGFSPFELKFFEMGEKEFLETQKTGVFSSGFYIGSGLVVSGVFFILRRRREKRDYLILDN